MRSKIDEPELTQDASDAVPSNRGHVLNNQKPTASMLVGCPAPLTTIPLTTIPLTAQRWQRDADHPVIEPQDTPPAPLS
jgi:hypothetical protein